MTISRSDGLDQRFERPFLITPSALCFISLIRSGVGGDDDFFAFFVIEGYSLTLLKSDLCIFASELIVSFSIEKIFRSGIRKEEAQRLCESGLSVVTVITAAT